VIRSPVIRVDDVRGFGYSVIRLAKEETARMNISLTPELEQLINEQVESGYYHTASEVIEDALRLFKERDEARQRRMEELRREIRIGLEQLDSGQARTYDHDSLRELFEQIKARGRARLAQQGKDVPP
jgi:antitoxin ParD1/3/4